MASRAWVLALLLGAAAPTGAVEKIVAFDDVVAIQPDTSPTCTIGISAPATNILSEIVSRKIPSGETTWSRRAILPSAISLIAISSNSTTAPMYPPGVALRISATSRPLSA